MAGDASAALGVAELAGTFVNPKGMTKKMTAAATGGVVGGAIGTAAVTATTGGAYAGAPGVPSFGRVGYVAVTADEIALVKTNTGMIKMKISDEVLARAPRSELTRVELDAGTLLSHLTLEFDNGVAWEFDVPKAGKKSAKAVVDALGGSIT
jgi:hypothetical protein